MKLVNHRTGEYRELTPLGAIASTAFIGPFYYWMKGAIGAGFGVVFLGVVAALGCFFLGGAMTGREPNAGIGLLWILGLSAWWWFPVAMAYPLVKRHYRQRGFVSER